jgi:peptide/nickel transport system permease protein
MGILAATRKNTVLDYVANVVALFGLSIPNFWLGIMLILLVSVQLRWLPASGYEPIFDDPLRSLRTMIMPAFVLGNALAATLMRHTRSSMLSVLNSDYIRTARAKGLIERLVINRHALKNALLPVVTLIGIEFAFLIGGLVVTEQVFNLNGVGRLFVLAVQNQDYTLTQALVMLTVAIFVFTNLVVDLLYAWLDPRIRFG